MSDILALQQEIEAAEAVVVQRDRMLKLSNNPEFRALILDGFCKDECARYTHLSADPNLAQESRADALAVAQAAGHLKRWINAIVAMGNNAERHLPEQHAELAELRAEESAED